VWGDALDGATVLSAQADADTIRVGEAVNEKVRDVFDFKPAGPAAWVLASPQNG
jgi:hypothetical protein